MRRYIIKEKNVRTLLGKWQVPDSVIDAIEDEFHDQLKILVKKLELEETTGKRLCEDVISVILDNYDPIHKTIYLKKHETRNLVDKQ